MEMMNYETPFVEIFEIVSEGMFAVSNPADSDDFGNGGDLSN